MHPSANLEIGDCSQLVSLARLFMLESVVAQFFHDGDIDALKACQVVQRRALAVRDGGCAFFLCGHHHRLLHHTEWSVDFGDDRKTRFYPPTAA
ncbi:hypothetical protein [Rhodococcus sp. IEGM 1379]|uniref:hypothetical protein n=1 Tax=Rhodococcus sp. IEGM 1379 TaxID=3047086 RepID=UPI0024B70F2C|nr:hypothetical protein [Rhodococcus sp. IEGM 1379]MDI9919201.1 hypothetical protein [Rhodococcus sp. IEGM 1379]